MKRRKRKTHREIASDLRRRIRRLSEQLDDTEKRLEQMRRDRPVAVEIDLVGEDPNPMISPWRKMLTADSRKVQCRLKHEDGRTFEMTALVSDCVYATC